MPVSKPLVIVESPAKARTISRFLGDEYQVEASVGHIRDLPQGSAELPKKYKGHHWSDLAVNVDKDFEPVYVLTQRGKEQVKKLKAMLKDAPELLLATDEDREGEAIAWHLTEALKPKVPIRRLVFHEITRRAIEESLDNARAIDMDLVRAQETRRIVDRLFGYRVSKVLWRKVKPRLSAGRVQSVAVRLLVDREKARMAFVSSTWWGLSGVFQTPEGTYSGDLMSLGDKKIPSGKDFEPTTGQLKAPATIALLDEDMAKALQVAILANAATVTKVEEKDFREKPQAPFTTSKLQQEANRKFRWTARRAMGVAQRLYENGWITYMRTDSVHLSPEAINAARDYATQHYGPQYVPETPRKYNTKAKGAQEAHEAIRPAGESFKSVPDCAKEMGEDEARLYELIFKRTLACQMADATGKRVVVETQVQLADQPPALFRSRGKTYTFDGFRAVYVVAGGDQDSENLLPPLKEGQNATPKTIDADGHTTQPPSRLSEAALVQRLEELGIGRPSTYASIIETIQNRGYVFKKGTALIPTWTAFAVTRLLEEHFEGLVNYDFTANLESGLDQIAEGEKEPKEFLEAFYRGSGGDGLEELIAAALDSADPRSICSIPIGQSEGKDVIARVGRYGPYLEYDGTTRSLPDEMAPDELTLAKAVELLNEMPDGPRELGDDPETSLKVTVQVGRFGPYVQLGEPEGKKKPKRASLLKGMEVDTVDLPTALQLLALPRTVGKDTEGHEILAYNGRYGPYIKANGQSRTIPVDIHLLEINEEQALKLLAEPARRGRASASVLKDLGEDPEGRKVVVKKGRYGPYVTDGEVNVTLPKDKDPEQMELVAVLPMLQAKRDAGGGKKKRAAPKKKAAAKKPAAKKAPAKKAAPKKPAAKKAPAKKAAPKKPAAKKAAPKKPVPAKKAGATATAETAKQEMGEVKASSPRVRRSVRRPSTTTDV
ncbi:MAG: DNA topoisomerase-1 [Cognaticolwellia sp.]|jgi:DNA topoisomerase-1